MKFEQKNFNPAAIYESGLFITVTSWLQSRTSCLSSLAQVSRVKHGHQMLVADQEQHRLWPKMQERDLFLEGIFEMNCKHQKDVTILY